MNIVVFDREATYMDYLSHYLKESKEPFSISMQEGGNSASTPAHTPDVVIAPFNAQSSELFQRYTSDPKTANVSFLFVTEESYFSPEMAKLQASGPVAFLNKPVTQFELISRFTNLIKYSKQLVYLDQTKSELESQKSQLEDMSIEQGYLMSIVAHDLKSPLNKVLGLIQLLPLVGEMNAEQQKCIDLVNKVVEGGRKLIDDILIINAYESHLEPLKFNDLDLNVFVKDSLSTFQQQAENKNIQLHFVAAEPIQVYTDKESLSRILDNLIDNAIKFSQRDTEVFVSLRKTKSHALIAVQDQGPGISPEDQKKMFKKFQKLSARPTEGESSTGLGLSIIKVLVEKLEGRIKVESEVGVGTTFTVFLPFRD